jgi:hypothetical protein
MTSERRPGRETGAAEDRSAPAGLMSTSRIPGIADTGRWETALRGNQQACNPMDGVS